ncbi:MAG: acyl-CoA dehydrogenase [Thermodesulfobacteriota bacterium]
MAARFFSMRNLKFLLYEVFDCAALAQYEYYRQHNRKAVDMVLEAAATMAQDLLWPILQEMDRQPPVLEDGRVKVHRDVRKILKEFGEGGWIGAHFPETLDGEQLPLVIGSAARFIFAAANYSAAVYGDLCAGAAHLIATFGDRRLVDIYVPNMLAGRWQGTMALTEPQAGSSLSDITTTASPAGDGAYRIKGQKIFISAGDHDGAENVIHLMLARIEGAPAGIRGISLFVVPKKRPDASGKLTDNDITVAAVYHKLGYRGAPITELSIGEKDGCHGYLVGEPHQGLKYMFQMMNEARLGVGLGAAAITSAAYYSALEYTRARPQGRKIQQKDPTQPQIPIIEHADVKRMLLFQRSVLEGSLALLLQCSLYADLEKMTEGDNKERNHLLLEILTPVAKTYPSEMGVLSVSAGLQCFGGYGYCDDFPLEQYYRDVRIHPIHEGTTAIQGMDLLGRKVAMKDGKAFLLLADEVNRTISAARKNENLNGLAGCLQDAMERLQAVTLTLGQKAQKEGVEAFLADATLYLEMFGIITIAWQWLKQALVAESALSRKCSEGEMRFYQGKSFTCRYFFGYELPKILGLAARLTGDDNVTVEMPTACFSD